MFRILVVDDERIEREGIRFLIEANHHCLEIVEAENGKKALEYIQSNEVDILFTDIKMPFIDGLELAEQTKKINPGIKIVIFSAFGEFDYALKAIESNVLHYILKPIDVSEFLELMNRLIRICTEEEEQKRKADEIFKGYLNDREHQRSKMLYDLVNETEMNEQYARQIENEGICLNGFIVLMLVYVKDKLFDMQGDAIEHMFKDMIECNYKYLVINERQSLLFLYGFDTIPERDYLSSLGQTIRQYILSSYGQTSYILFSSPVSRIEELPGEYTFVEQALDYRFYYEEGAVLFADNAIQNTTWDKINNRLLSDIYDSLDSKEFNETTDLVGKLFASFKLNANLSPVFVKYQCTNILRKIHEAADSQGMNDFSQQIEKVFENNNLMDLKKFIQDRVAFASQKEPDGSKESIKRVVRDVLDIVANEYMKDLSLEYISQKVYMTPSYLGYLFKKEMGMTPVKYITQYRMDKARSLLLNTNMKIVDIAQSLGYSNMSYFGMLFRNKFGSSPARLREERDAR